MEGKGDFCPYLTLGLSKGTTVEEVKAKYASMMLLNKKNTNDSSETSLDPMTKLRAAYLLLTDNNLYDKFYKIFDRGTSTHFRTTFEEAWDMCQRSFKDQVDDESCLCVKRTKQLSTSNPLGRRESEKRGMLHEVAIPEENEMDDDKKDLKQQSIACTTFRNEVMDLYRNFDNNFHKDIMMRDVEATKVLKDSIEYEMEQLRQERIGLQNSKRLLTEERALFEKEKLQFDKGQSSMQIEKIEAIKERREARQDRAITRKERLCDIEERIAHRKLRQDIIEEIENVNWDREQARYERKLAQDESESLRIKRHELLEEREMLLRSKQQIRKEEETLRAERDAAREERNESRLITERTQLLRDRDAASSTSTVKDPCLLSSDRSANTLPVPVNKKRKCSSHESGPGENEEDVMDEEVVFSCQFCNRKFSYKVVRDNHESRVHY